MSTLQTEKLIQKLKDFYPKKDFIPLHEPIFQGNEIKYVTNCIETGWVSSVGSYVDAFEKNLAEFTGVKRAVAVVNGTAALHVCLKLVGVAPGDEVLIPALTFVATANAITYAGAVPHFVDVSHATLGVDPIKLEDYLAENTIQKDGQTFNKHTQRRISAIVPMHTFGHPVEMDKLVKVANTYHIELIEDAAESLGSFYKGKHTGNFGKISAVSFNGNKVITTGGGGAILTNDEKLGKHAKHITTTAKIPHPYEYMHDEIAFNYRMPNLNAALGCSQLELLPEFLSSKRKLATAYKELFNDIEGCTFFEEPADCQSNYWLHAILLDESNRHLRNAVIEKLNTNGIMTRPIWRPLNELNMYATCPSMDLVVTRELAGRVINIPSSANLI